MFESKSMGEYHEDMNGDVFEEYFEQVITLVPCNSVGVMDNTGYHPRKTKRLPFFAEM